LPLIISSTTSNHFPVFLARHTFMAATTRFLLLASVALAYAAVADAGNRNDSNNCPPVSTVLPFSLEAYTDGPWFIQKQQPVRYQPEEALFCVRASYSLQSDGSVSVLNTANIGGVDGPPQNANRMMLRALVENDEVPSKLLVGPRFLPRFAYGPYWVVATSATTDEEISTDGYEWAIVSGGQPMIDTGSGCKTGDGVNNAGLWLFTREQIASPDVVERMRTIAADMGFDVSVLKDVQQAGCSYPDEQ